MTYSRSFLLALMLLVGGGVSVAQAQSAEDALRFGQRLPSTGVRMIGLSGAGAAGIGDFGALFTNPAGLGLVQRSTFAGALQTIATVEDGTYQLPGFTNTIDEDVRATGIGSLAYLYKSPTVRGSLVFGAAFTETATFERQLSFLGDNGRNSITDFFMPVNREYEIDQEAGEDGLLDTADDVFTPSFFRDLSFIGFETFAIDFDRARFDADEVPFLPAVTAGTVRQSGTVTEEGGIRELSFGAGFEAARNVMVGLSVNIPFGRYEFRRVFDEEDFQNDNDGTGGTTDFDFLRFQERIESDLVGVNVRGGFSALAMQNLRIGMSIESPTLYTVNKDFSTQLETFFDNNDSFIYGDDFSEDVGAGSFEYQIRTPWRLSGGVAFSLGNLLLLADAEFVDWTQLELDADQAGLFDRQNLFIEENFDAVVNTRFGAEYALGSLTLRGGYAYQPDPRDPRVPNDEPDRSKSYFSAGFSYHFGPAFALDFGWSQERFDDRFAPYSEVRDAPMPVPVVSEEVSRNRFAVGIRAFF